MLGYGLNLTPRSRAKHRFWESPRVVTYLHTPFFFFFFFFYWNNCKQHSELLTCCFWSTVSKCGTHFECSFLIDKCSCKMVNILSSDIFNSSAILCNFNLWSGKATFHKWHACAPSSPLHMDEQRQDNQLDPIYNSSVLIQDIGFKAMDNWRESHEDFGVFRDNYQIWVTLAFNIFLSWLSKVSIPPLNCLGWGVLVV